MSGGTVKLPSILLPSGLVLGPTYILPAHLVGKMFWVSECCNINPNNHCNSGCARGLLDCNTYEPGLRTRYAFEPDLQRMFSTQTYKVTP